MLQLSALSFLRATRNPADRQTHTHTHTQTRLLYAPWLRPPRHNNYICITTYICYNTTCSLSKIIASNTTQACPTTAGNSSNPPCPGVIHGGYVAVILVLVAIIITLVILMGYLFKRTTPQRGPVQTTHQPLTDMTASDYMEPVALRQLQTSTEPGQRMHVCTV